jgi:hypothetical protein
MPSLTLCRPDQVSAKTYPIIFTKPDNFCWARQECHEGPQVMNEVAQGRLDFLTVG